MVYKDINGRKLSRICLGCAPYGTRLSEDEAFEIMDRYYAAGGNVFDSAHLYSAGHSEKILGKWVRLRGVREDVFLCTKGGHPDPSNPIPRINEKELKRDIEQSLERLGLDCVDMYFLHRDDPSKPVEEIMPVLDSFVKSGKAKALGASNWTAERIRQANDFAEKNGLCPFTFTQIMHSGAKINKEGVADKTLVVMDDNEKRAYLDSDMVIMAYTSQAQGLFSHLQRMGWQELPERLREQYMNPVTVARAEKILEIARETGLSPTAISLGYLLNDALDSMPIIGAYSLPRLEESLQILALDKKYADVFNC